MSIRALLFRQSMILTIGLLLLFVYPLIPVGTSRDNTKSEIIVHDNAGVNIDSRMLRKPRTGIVVIEVFDSIPPAYSETQSINEFIKKRFAVLSRIYGDSFKKYGLLVIGSEKQNFTASWLGEKYNNINSSSKDFRKSFYFDQQTNPKTSLEQKIEATLNMAIDVIDNASMVKVLAEEQIWDVLYNATEPSPTIWYRYFVNPCQRLFSTPLRNGSIIEWYFALLVFAFFWGRFVLFLGELRLAIKSAESSNRKSKIVSFICWVIPYLTYFIPITLGVLPIAVYICTPGMEFVGARTDLGLSNDLTETLFSSGFASMSIWASFVSSFMFTFSNSPSLTMNLSPGVILVTIVNAMICSVFFWFPLGLNIVFYILCWPAFLKELHKKEVVEDNGEKRVLYGCSRALPNLLFSLVASGVLCVTYIITN